MLYLVPVYLSNNVMRVKAYNNVKSYEYCKDGNNRASEFTCNLIILKLETVSLSSIENFMTIPSSCLGNAGFRSEVKVVSHSNLLVPCMT